MNTHTIAAAVAVALTLSSGSDAQAKIFIYSAGDKISNVASLPPSSPLFGKENRFVGERPTKVGYKHFEFSLFWIPFWTGSEGEFVAYADTGLMGKSYYQLGTNVQDVSNKTGVPVSELKVPWGARNPWGLYALIGIVCIWGVSALAGRRSGAKESAQE